MPQIQLTKGKVVVVDDLDFEELSQWKWHIAQGYAARTSSRKDGPQRKIFMHRIISKAKEDECVDHVNRDRLDNRRANLRICTYAQNRANSVFSKNNACQKKGVSISKNKFRAMIRANGKTRHIGTFNTPEEANKAYAEAAAKHFGEFSRS